MLIDVYIAAIEKSEHKAEWNAFSRFLKTYPAQKILAENGYRPVNKQALTESRNRFPVRAGETKITDKLLRRRAGTNPGKPNPSVVAVRKL